MSIRLLCYGEARSRPVRIVVPPDVSSRSTARVTERRLPEPRVGQHEQAHLSDEHDDDGDDQREQRHRLGQGEGEIAPAPPGSRHFGVPPPNMPPMLPNSVCWQGPLGPTGWV